jgi:predicted RND superfamily exporter protein
VKRPWINPFVAFPGTALLLCLVLAGPLLLKLPGLGITSETNVLLEGDQRNLSSYEKVRRILSGLEVVVIDLECGEVFSQDGIEAVRRVSEAFSRQPGVDDVKSLTHSVKPVRRGWSFDMVPLVPPEGAGAAELARLKEFCVGHPLIRNVVVSADARHALITVTYRRDLGSTASQRTLQAEVDSVLKPFVAEGLRFRTLALPLVGEEIRATILRDLTRFLPLTALLVLVVLWFTFRSWVAILLVLINQGALLVLMPGVILAAGLSVNLFSIMLLPLLAGIQLEQLAHLFMEVQRRLANQEPAGAAVNGAARDVHKGCAFALLTTAIGLLSLLSGDVQQIRDFGLLGALGIVVIFLITFGPGLSLLVLAARHLRFAPPRASAPAGAGPQGEGAASSSGASRLAAWSARFRVPIVLVTIACVGFAGMGWMQVRTDIRAVEFLNPASPTRQAVETLDHVYGGVNVVQIDIDSGASNGVNRLDFLRYLEKVQRYAQSRRDISGAYSYAQLLAMIHQVWEGERPDALRLPDSSVLITLFVTALRSYNYPFLAALIDDAQRTAYLVLRTRDMPSERYLEVVDDVTDYARRTAPKGVQVSAANGIHTILEADRRIIRSQTRSAGLTAAVIALVLALLWRSPVLALISLFANAVPTALVIAGAGYAGIPLNSITIMVAAISLGIAVDNSIHLITRWRDEVRRDGDSQAALQRTLAAKMRPMIWSSLVLLGICPVFWFSSFPPVVHFGALTALSFVCALLGTLFLLPALLSWVRR